MIMNVVSLSGGKDSTATMILALETQPLDSLRFVFADTGNEHEATYEYVMDYLQEALDVQIDVVRADFASEFETKRANLARIAAGEPESAVYGKREFMYRWTPDTAARALELLHPTGVPFLDLCLVRGGFPSRKRQYCTEYLKTKPLTEYSLEILGRGEADAIWSWQGVRIDESESRRRRLGGTGACVKSFEPVGGGIFNYRPILRWKAADCFEAHHAYGIQPNPLYRQGMSRVGCMPCINASKNEIGEIARRFPHHIERIAEWERLVSSVTRPRSPVSFFHHTKTEDNRNAAPNGIHRVVEWSRTTRGGRQFDLLANLAEPTACSSAYGLCE